jgi:hypothetical protein
MPPSLTNLETRICVAGVVNDQDVLELRALIWQGGVPVNRAATQALFRMKDATLRGENSPDWLHLFVEAVADYLRTRASGPTSSSNNTGWLRRKIAIDAGLDEVEKALLAYLSDEGNSTDWSEFRGYTKAQ